MELEKRCSSVCDVQSFVIYEGSDMTLAIGMNAFYLLTAEGFFRDLETPGNGLENCVEVCMVPYRVELTDETSMQQRIELPFFVQAAN